MKIKIKVKSQPLTPFSIREAIEFHRQVVAALVARHIRDQILETLDTQSLSWPPLSEAYLKYKKAQGLDTRMLLATHFYRDHIESWSEGPDRHFVGIRDNTVHEPSGQPLAQIARTHEFGTRNVPARPLWRPVISRLLRDKKILYSLYDEAVKNKESNE